MSNYLLWLTIGSKYIHECPAQCHAFAITY